MASLNAPQSILIVCLGNICRSPTGEFVLREELTRAGLDIQVDSCGTGSWHIGEGADPRSVAAAARAGYDLAPHRVRQLSEADFDRFDLILGMDESNMDNIEERRPAGSHARVDLFLKAAGIASPREVPDPYHGTREDFDAVVALIRRGVKALVQQLR